MSQFTDTTLSRRAVLRAGGTALAAGVAASAGCSGLPPLGTAVKYGAVAVPETRPPAYRQWLPEPSAYPEGSDASDGYSVWVYAPPPADAPGWARGSVARTFIGFRTDYVGVHIDDASVALSNGTAAALLGDYDRDAVVETLAQTAYEADGTLDGDEVYVRADTGRTLAVCQDGLVFADGPDARAKLAATVAAGRGDAARLHEHDEDVAALTDRAGTRRWLWLWPDGVGRMDAADDLRADTVGWAGGFDHDADGAYYVETWLFPPGYDITEGRVKAALDRNGRARDAEAVAVTVEGRGATVAMRVDVDDEYYRRAPGPYVTWRVVYDDAADRLTFQHDAGDPVATDQLVVAAMGMDDVSSFDGVGDTVESGERLSVSTAGLDPGTTVRLVYESPEDNGRWNLARYELP